MNGTYAFNFSGSGGGEYRTGEGPAPNIGRSTVSCRCTVYPGSDPGMKGGMAVTNVTFDAATYTTAGLITISAGAPALAELIINGTRRTASSPLGSGFTNLRVMRPRHGAGSGEVPGRAMRRTRCPDLARMRSL